MPDLAQVLTPKFDKVHRSIQQPFGIYQVATLTPTFTVYLNGDLTAPMPGRKVAGATYSVGTKGMYILPAQGQRPWCFVDVP